MSKDKKEKPVKKRKPNARVKLSRDLVAERKALRERIKELIKKEKSKSRDIKSLRYGKARS